MPWHETIINSINVDNKRAHDFASEYMQAVTLELITHAGIMSCAMQKYGTFLGLQTIMAWYEDCASAAFSALSL